MPTVDAPDGAQGFALAENISAVLELEELDRDLFRGVNSSSARDRVSLFGGQVAAQALMAAGRTVSSDRLPHSLHGYFLRPGRPDRAVILRVDRDRDGGSFSARHVSAIQDGDVIFSMLASFHIEESSGEFDGLPHVEAPMPDSDTGDGWDDLVDLRRVTAAAPAPDTMRPDHLWVKILGPLPDDPLAQTCALAYVSDFGSGFDQVTLPGVRQGGPSIDHAVWFHAPVRADDWLLLELWPAKAGGARGVYFGAIRDRAGRLTATVAQEMLLRPKPELTPAAAPTVTSATSPRGESPAIRRGPTPSANFDGQ